MSKLCRGNILKQMISYKENQIERTWFKMSNLGRDPLVSLRGLNLALDITITVFNNVTIPISNKNNKEIKKIVSNLLIL